MVDSMTRGFGGPGFPVDNVGEAGKINVAHFLVVGYVENVLVVD
jgi:hypothetical protein